MTREQAPAGDLVGDLVAQDIQVTGTGLAAVGGGRAFLIARPAGGKVCGTRFYEFRIGPTGHPGPLAPLPVPLVQGEVASMAASANGNVIAFSGLGCGKGSRTYLGAVDVVTGRVRQWGGVDVDGEGRGNQLVTGEVSVTADGRLLAYQVTTSAVVAVRVLPTNAPAGTAARRSRVVARFGVPLAAPPVYPPIVVHGTWLAAAVIGAAGHTIDACITTADAGKGSSPELVRYAIATGHRLRGMSPVRCYSSALSRDPSGRYLLEAARPALGQGGPGAAAVFRVARVDLVTGKVSWLTVTTPSGAMSSAVTGMLLAW